MVQEYDPSLVVYVLPFLPPLTPGPCADHRSVTIDFLTIPMFLLVLALRNGQPLFRKETVVMLVVGSAGFVSNFYSGKAFVGRADISSAIGSFAVGLLGNLYGKFTRGSPFVVMVPGCVFSSEYTLLALPPADVHAAAPAVCSSSCRLVYRTVVCCALRSQPPITPMVPLATHSILAVSARLRP